MALDIVRYDKKRMWKTYSNIIQRYPRVSLFEERHLISEAQKGSKKSKDEIVLRHISFLIFRIHRLVFPVLIQQFGEDLLEEAILIIYTKIESYNLNHCDKQGDPNPVKFVSYIWKRIDGFIIDFLKKEIRSAKKLLNFGDNIVASDVIMNHYHSSKKWNR